MKKLVAITAVLLAGLVSAVPAQAIESAISGEKQIKVASMVNVNLRNPKVMPLPKGSSLITWLEEKPNVGYFIKTRTVSSTNKLGKVFTLNSSAAYTDMSLDNLPQVVTNGKGQFFATWIVSYVTDGVTYEKIVGRSSNDGINWTKIKTVVEPLAVTGGRNCMGEAEQPNCGYVYFRSAIDGKGKMAVLVAHTTDRSSMNYFATTSSNISSWPTPEEVINMRYNFWVSIDGLRSGFALHYPEYVSGTSCRYLLRYFDSAAGSWGNTLVASSADFNTVIFGKVIQRSADTLSVVMTPQEGAGILVKNFSLSSKNFTDFEVVAKEPVTDVVYQTVSVAARGTKMAIGYTTYDRTNHTTSARLIVQSGVEGGFTETQLERGVDQVYPLYIGVSKAGYPFFAYMQYTRGTHLTTLKGSSQAKVLNNKANVGYLSSMYVSATDQLYAVGMKGDGGTYSIYLTRGKLK